jgi:ubiquinone/menaquinone biosynthesis C-methylase UbiE
MSFASPEKNIALLGLSAGKIVADLGTGTGHYAFAASKIVGAEGRVYAIDVQKDLLDRLQQEIEQKGIHNIDVMWGDTETIGGSKLKVDAVDAVIASNILFQVESKGGFIHEIKRILKKGGSVLVIDWAESFAGLGPDPQHVVSEEVARGLFENNGFALEKTFDAGAHHYGMVFKNVV